MFPPSTLSPTLDLGQWGENFQDLSSWCRKPPRGTSSITVDDTKGSSCIAQDDELNTPVIGKYFVLVFQIFLFDLSERICKILLSELPRLLEATVGNVKNQFMRVCATHRQT